MRLFRPCAIALCLTIGAVARADDVHLTTGRSVTGKIVEETPEHVVVKTPKGRITLPRRLIKSITKQDAANTWLSLAKERLRAGSLDEAARLYRKAARSNDSAVVKAAAAGLAKVEAAREARARDRAARDRAARDRARAAATPPRTPTTRKAPGKMARRAWGYDEARAALRKGDGRRALTLLTPLRKTRKADPVFLYLLGRALHLRGSTKGAYGAYRQVVELFRLQRKLPPVFLPPVAGRLEDLARRSFAEPLRSGAPGIDDEWQRIEVGKRFAIYHKLDFHHPIWGTAWESGFTHFRGHLKAAQAAVLKAFELEARDLGGGDRAPRVLVILYPSSDAHAAAGGSAHARHVELPDGWLHQLDAFQIQATTGPIPARQRRNNPIDALKHKVAHTILRDAFALPAWTEEAASAYVASPGNADRAELIRVGLTAELPSVQAFLTHKVQPERDATRFDAQGLLIFRALVDLCGSVRKALDLCVAMRAQGANPALKNARLSLQRVERACRKLRTPR